MSLKLQPIQSLSQSSAPYLFATQKARGLCEIRDRETENAYGVNFEVPKFHIFTSRPTALPFTAKEYFARPCPVTPQHGFVDSRRCSTLADIQKVWDEARAVDPQAEMILMPVVEATISAIWTSGALSIGPGNDGATSGHGSILIPTMDAAPLPPPYKTVNDSPFFEFVIEQGKKPSLVQMRDGPALPKVRDYVPHKQGCKGENINAETAECDDCGKYFETKAIIEATGDLLEWQEIAKNLKPGTVVHHVGGTLASHYAVHCMLHGIPILCTRVPAVGEMLAPLGLPKRRADINAMLDGVRIGLHLATAPNKDNFLAAAMHMLASLHNITAMDLSDPNQAKIVGAGMGFAVRLGFTASIGEYRHKHSFKGSGGKVLARHEVFCKFWNNFNAMRKTMRKAQRSFMFDGWSGAMGGKKWAMCLAETINLWNAVCALQTPDAAKRKLVEKAITALNVVVNSAHNTGFYLNKFVSNHVFDVAAGNPARIACLSMETFWNVLAAKIDESTTKRFRTTELRRLWVPRPEVSVHHGKPKFKGIEKVAFNQSATKKYEYHAPTPPAPKVVEDSPLPTHIGKIVAAQAKLISGKCHFQFRVEGEMNYRKFDLVLAKHPTIVSAFAKAESGDFTGSMAGGSTPYLKLTIAQSEKVTLLVFKGTTLVEIPTGGSK